jgi:hypothetical protein
MLMMLIAVCCVLHHSLAEMLYRIVGTAFPH